MSKEKASSHMNNRINGSSRQTTRKSSSPVMLLFPLLIIGAIIGGIIFVLNGKEEEPKNIVVTEENIEQVIAEMKEEQKTPTGSYEVMMTTEWHFSDSESASEDAYVANPVTNRNTVYFTITLSDSGEEIFKSPYIPVGSSLSNITLDYPLEKGTYNGVLTYHLVDTSNIEVSRVSVGVTIIIEQ